MANCVLFRIAGDESAYVVDLEAGSVSRVEPGVDIQPQDGQQFRGLDLAIVSNRREATATFPVFAD